MSQSDVAGAGGETLTRLCLAADGRVKAQFSDNSLLLLSASGASFCHKSASDAQPFRQLTDFAISRYAPKLAVALHFRNMHWDTPYVLLGLVESILHGSQSSGKEVTLGFRIAEVWWPADAAAAQAAGLVQHLPDGSLALSSVDSSARLVLQCSHQRFAACYPLLYSTEGGQFHYRWHTQVFSVAACPERWQEALTLLLSVAQDAGGSQSGSQEPLQLGPVPPTTQTPSLPTEHQQGLFAPLAVRTGQVAADTGPSSSALILHSPHHRTPCSVLPAASTRQAHSASDGFAPGSWWFEPSQTLLPSDELLLMEWTPEATYEFVPGTGEVLVWLADSDACVVSERQGRFVRHVYGGGGQGGVEDKMYAAECVPENVWVLAAAGGMQRCPLEKYAAHALKFREKMCAVLARHQAQQRDAVAAASAELSTCPIDSFNVQSDEVLETEDIAGVGTFTAYRDGRVRAMCLDRTIMHLNSTHTHCKVISPTGQRLVIAVDQPIGYEDKVQALLSFCRWAFHTPDERDAILHAHALVSVQAAATARMVQLMKWSNNQEDDTRGYPDNTSQSHATQSAEDTQPTCHPASSLAENAYQHWNVEDVLRRNAELLHAL